MQGGLIAGFLDEVMGAALLASTDDAALPLNLDMNLSFVRMVPLERITAKGRLHPRASSSPIPTPMPDPASASAN